MNWFIDNLINFGLSSIYSRLTPEQKNRFLFCISSDSSWLVENNPNHLVRTLLRLFEFEFIFFPTLINTNHWILLIVWNIDSTKQGRILVLDSLRGHVPRDLTQLCNSIYSLLNQVWRNQPRSQQREFSQQTMPVVHISCPQQGNNYDCGLYTLLNIERFCSNPPANLLSITDDAYSTQFTTQEGIEYRACLLNEILKDSDQISPVVLND